LRPLKRLGLPPRLRQESQKRLLQRPRRAAAATHSQPTGARTVRHWSLLTAAGSTARGRERRYEIAGTANICGTMTVLCGRLWIHGSLFKKYIYIGTSRRRYQILRTIYRRAKRLPKHRASCRLSRPFTPQSLCNKRPAPAPTELAPPN
jgi:hypothetical protein